MLSKAITAIAFAFALTAGSAHATVTLQFSQPLDTGIASGFSTRTGVDGVDGLRWGIIVDTTGNGFANSGTAYSGLSGGPTVNAFMSVDGAATDDYFIAASDLTADFSIFTEGDFTTPGGKGTIDQIASVPFGTNGIGLGDKFALVWFDSSTANDGDYYGFFTDNAFTIPADGVTEGAYASVFTGADPIRNASNQFVNNVPEPSRLLLLGLAMIGLVFRRRR